MRGRKPVPARLRVLGGNASNRPVPNSVPVVAAEVGDPPRWLNRHGKAAWRKLAPELEGSRVMAVSDSLALELLVDAYSEYRGAREVIMAHGPTYETKGRHGMQVKRRPQVAIAADAWNRLSKMLTEFGLTPSSRTRIEPLPSSMYDETEEFLFGTLDRPSR